MLNISNELVSMVALAVPLGFPSRCQHTVTQLKPSSKLAVQNVYLGMGPIGQCLLFDDKPEPGEEY
jgi:hypothetical protein